MTRKKSTLSKLLILLVIVLIFFSAKALFSHNANSSANTKLLKSLSVIPTKELQFGTYIAPKIEKKPYYKIALVGDSMTFALGIYGGKLSEELNKLYQSTPGNQKIVIDNHAIGSTNVLDLYSQLTSKRTVGDVTLEPVVSDHPDLLLIESFGYNPLSQLGLINGQKKQTETLDKIMTFLSNKLPNTAIMFVATIAPNKETYAENEQPGSSLTDRKAQAEERIAYIKNHIAYADSHKIPLIDIYDKSLTPNGDGDLTYIDPSDHIHPSFAGIDFISTRIANAIYASKILPQ